MLMRDLLAKAFLRGAPVPALGVLATASFPLPLRPLEASVCCSDTTGLGAEGVEVEVEKGAATVSSLALLMMESTIAGAALLAEEADCALGENRPLLDRGAAPGAAAVAVVVGVEMMFFLELDRKLKMPLFTGVAIAVAALSAAGTGAAATGVGATTAGAGAIGATATGATTGAAGAAAAAIGAVAGRTD